MKKLAFLKNNWSAKKVLTIFIIWTTIWLIILFRKIELKHKRNKIIDYRIFTPGCQIEDIKNVPKFILWLKSPYAYVPKCPMPQFEVIGRKVLLNKMEEGEPKNCTIIPFKRVTDEQNVYELGQDISFQPIYAVPNEKTNFFQLKCASNSSENTSTKDYGFLAPSIESKPEIKSFKTSNKTFSVLLLGLNKVTNAEADIQLKRTMEFLKQQPNFLDFKGFTGLGCSAISNMLSILTGREKATSKEENNTNFYYDNLNFIWKTFSANKFYTVFGENTYKKSLFNSPNKGFKKQPTDYYLRPFLVQIDNEDAFEPKSDVVTPGETTDPGIFEPFFRYKVPPTLEEKCKGSRHEQHIVLELMRQFLPFYLNRPTFSFYWLSRKMPFLPHDDAAIEKLLTKYKEAGIFERTFLFVISNVHCLKSKNLQPPLMKQPILFALVPEDFKKYYPMKYDHFKANTQRLTTPYDLHATLLHLADLTGNSSGLEKVLIEGQPRSYLHGINLFNQNISSSRTCQEAFIPVESCLCTT